MAIQALRGFRDYYPEDQAKINYLRDKIAEKCRRFGYEEFDGPIVESFDLYAAKSSDEIVSEQAFTFEDRGGDKIALRPELTPTLARMIAAKQNELVFPLRWWSLNRFWRYERPQKGRSREFYQWNLDLIGDDTAEADTEVLTILIRFYESLGLTANDVVFELSDRSFITEFLAQNNVSANQVAAVFKYLDRLPKLTDEEAKQFANQLDLSDNERILAEQLFNDTNLWQQSARLMTIFTRLENQGLSEWVRPSLAIVRGFTYYTGIVFEAFDRQNPGRSLLGGGRYSNLVAAVGGQSVSAVGMGMGTLPISELLESKNLFPPYKLAEKVVIVITPESNPLAAQTAKNLREKGITTILFYGDFGKGLKFASRKNADYAILVGDNEIASQTVTIKNLTTGEQNTLPRQEIETFFTQ